MNDLPLLGHFEATGVVAWRGERPVECRGFVAEVKRLAERLPARAYVFNLCKDRYHFLVGFAAALLRRQTSLLPPSEVPRVLQDIAERYPEVYCLTDQRELGLALEVVRYEGKAGPPAASMHVPAFAAEQVAAIAFTSGTTGEPQPNVKTWGGLVAESHMASARLWSRRSGAATVVGTVPPQHMFGLAMTVLLPLQAGFALHAGRPLFPEDVRVALAAVPGPRVLVTTPLHIYACVAAQLALPALEFILSATAPLSVELARQAEEMFHTEVLEIYGCTEAGSIATRRTVEGNLWRTYDEMSLSLQDGRCFVRGPSFDGAVELNDVVQLRNVHEFSLHGRVADLINVAGKRASLADLNRKLTEIEGVHDGSFFMPEESADGVSRLMAFVVAPGLSKQDVLRALRDRIDAVFLPRPLYMVKALPRTETGKLPRSHLQELAMRLAHRRNAAGDR